MNEPKQPIYIAVTNIKGGVGKTTTAIHLACGLARTFLHKRVLLVDMDPQGSASMGMGLQVADKDITVADLILDRNVPTEAAIRTVGNMDVMVANPSLDRVGRRIGSIPYGPYRLPERLALLKDKYSFIVIDTPPGVGPVLNMSLTVAEKVIVPIDSSFYALLGIKYLLGNIEELRDEANPRLSVLGFLMTMTDNTVMTREARASVARNFPDLIFKRNIRRSVDLRESASAGMPVYDIAPLGHASADYGRWTDEVLSRLGFLTPHEIVSAERSGEQ